MFYFMADFEIANYADESAHFSTKLDGKAVAEELHISSSILFTSLRKIIWRKIKTIVISCYLPITTPTADIDENVLESKGN